MIRRIESEADFMQRVATYDLGDGRRASFDVRDVQLYGLAALLKDVGAVPDRGERQPVFQGDKLIGTVPGDFDPMFIKSTSWLYEPRLGDFRREEKGWIADHMLGPGDLEAIPGFVWEPRR